jgi:hypothetical protein
LAAVRHTAIGRIRFSGKKALQSARFCCGRIFNSFLRGHDFLPIG